MNIDFSTIKKKLTIDGIELKSLSIDGVQVWKGGPTNLIPTSINTDGSIYNGNGLKSGYRLNSSGAEATTESYIYLTGYIPAKYGDTVYLDNLGFLIGNNQYAHCYLWTYDKSFAKIKGSPAHLYSNNFPGLYTTDATGNMNSMKLTHSTITNCAYIRVSFKKLDGIPATDAIITVNEPID